VSSQDVDFDAIVVGAGVVGLAVARALALSGRSVVVLEAEGSIGTGTSSRNSEVIHAGIYYPTGSLKARLCVEGRRRLYHYCAEHGVPHRKCGKLIVACDESEIAAVEDLYRRGTANDVEGLKMLDGSEARALEPELETVGALLSPETGILDSHALMLALQGEALDCGAAFAFRTPFLSAHIEHGALQVVTGGADPTQIAARILVNCAGLHASSVARAVEGVDRGPIPETRYAKGSYFALGRRAPFHRLIYPAPQVHGLGVHLTFDLAGQARFGPDVEWVEAIDFAVDPRRSEALLPAIRRYWPRLPDEALVPAYSGIRPKAGGPGDAAADFWIEAARHGPVVAVDLLGIESPGLTASLAIADHVLGLIATERSSP
jgi:L-2-hydroxyglutarate oxidase LhgO